MSTATLIDACVTACEENFNPALLGIEPVVALRERETTVKLEGWDEDRKAWRMLTYDTGEFLWADTIFDPNLCKTLAQVVHLGGDASLSNRYPVSVLQPYVDRVSEILES